MNRTKEYLNKLKVECRKCHHKGRDIRGRFVSGVIPKSLGKICNNCHFQMLTRGSA